MVSKTRSDALVEADWVLKHSSDPSIRLIEVDEDTAAYEVAHIPGAIKWHWRDDLRDPLRRDFVDAEGLQKLLARSGVDDGTTVILYGGNNNWFAAYAYWYLKYRGFDNVKLLDGGRKKWEREGLPMTTDAPEVKPAGRKPALKGARAELRAFRDDILYGQRDRNSVLIDVRSPEEFRGELLAPPHLPQEQAQVPGHVPGAQNVPWSKAAEEDGTFKSPEALRELYGAAGATPEKAIIAYCRIGERSSHTWFVLHELLGYADVRNYDGSWTEYGSMVGVPVER
jgi:thiosulfate/3-mercaptopyruvate sulfurtransferase